MKKRLLILLILSTLLLSIPTSVALAAPVYETVVSEGDTVDNDVVLFDDDLDVQSGAVVNGDVTIFDGDATVAGTVNGDIVIFDGNLTLTEGANLNGDCVLLDGTLDNQSGRSISCTLLENIIPGAIGGLIDEALENADFPSSIEVERPSPFMRFVGGVGETVGQTLVFGLLAFIIAAAAPRHLQQVAAVARQRPVASGAVGTLTFLGAPFVLVILAVLSTLLILACGLGLLGFPVLIALVLGLAAAAVLGWVALGSIAGERIGVWLNMENPSLRTTTVLGTMAVTLVLGLLGAIPFFIGEGLIGMLALWLGLGAVALTKFGTQPYPPLAADPVKLQEDSQKVTAVLETLPEEPESEV